MSFVDEDGKKCRCSRNRQCAFHAAQTKKMERVAQPMHDREKVTAGIEELRARYGKTPPVPNAAPSNGPRTGKNGWQR